MPPVEPPSVAPCSSEFVRCRNLIKEGVQRGNPRLICANCATAVYAVAQTEKSFFFRHSKEDGSCPAFTRSPYSARQITAMKYLGARESEAHKRMMLRLVQSLEADSSFADIKLERTWRSMNDASAYKRPDVQVQRGDVRIALEVQLSTTFLEVVVSRREFYRDEQAMLLWVLPRFNPDYRRLTDDDVFFSNNSNMVSSMTRRYLSLRSGGRFTCAASMGALSRRRAVGASVVGAHLPVRRAHAGCSRPACLLP